MSNKLKKLPRRATALLLAILLTLAPGPVSAYTVNHYSGWYGPVAGCEWRGANSSDEIGMGHAKGITWGRGECTQVQVRVWYNNTSVRGYGHTRADAGVEDWEVDFKYTDHKAKTLGPAPWHSRRLW